MRSHLAHGGGGARLGALSTAALLPLARLAARAEEAVEEAVEAAAEEAGAEEAGAEAVAAAQAQAEAAEAQWLRRDAAALLCALLRAGPRPPRAAREAAWAELEAGVARGAARGAARERAGGEAAALCATCLCLLLRRSGVHPLKVRYFEGRVMRLPF